LRAATFFGTITGEKKAFEGEEEKGEKEKSDYS
jgi:hypothetical protein